MFSNFIYFIIVLLVYTTYQAPEESNFDPFETIFLFFFMIFLFSAVTQWQFQRLKNKVIRGEASLVHLDHKFSVIQTRQSVMAIILFIIDIYGLNLTSFTSKIYLFSIIPTIEALFFILLFVGYLAIVWTYAYDAYQNIYPTGLPRRTYILSNILFAMPVLVPWALLSGIADIIAIQPFELPKRILSTTIGEVLYFLFFLCAVAMFGPLLIRIFWRCTPLEPGYERARIENLCRKAGLEYANILYWPIFGGRMITAGVMGLMKKFRYILVTEGLLSYLKPEEIEAVIAHEIGHVKKKHLLFYLVFFVGYMILSYATFDLIVYLILYAEPIYSFIANMGFNQATVVSGVFSCITILIFLIYFRYIFGYFMRNFERQADTYVYTLFESAAPLISTFEKIVFTSGQSPDKPNWHHFSISERIGYLKKCEADKIWITRQDSKIRKSIAVYLAGILLIGGIGYHLNFGEVGEKLNHHFFEKIILGEIKRKPENASLYSMLGDFYHQNKNYENTITAYEESIRLLPDNNPHALNNLAWLYATCENEEFRNPKRALDLAQKAAQQMKSHYIFDTLAESYYINGYFEEAVATEKQALALAPPKERLYYETQLKKFVSATSSD